jgi:hypothetical protein
MKSPKVPLHPKYPERTCWGCDKYCPADSLACGNGTIRTLHPSELFGDDWIEWIDQRGCASEAARGIRSK